MAKKTWQLDETHSEISFKIKHLMITNVRGGFKSFSATYDGKNGGSVKINADTINTGEDKRDEHLKNSDFLEVTSFPYIEFDVTEIKGRKLSGNLTIKGQTRPIELKVRKGKIKDLLGNPRVGFSAEGTIKRSDFGLTWNAALETGGVLLSDEVQVSGELQFFKA